MLPFDTIVFFNTLSNFIPSQHEIGFECNGGIWAMLIWGIIAGNRMKSDETNGFKQQDHNLVFIIYLFVEAKR